MEPVSSWSPEKVTEWLRGLEPTANQYPFEAWHLTGEQLLNLSYQDLEKLGVSKIGHQELFLEAIESLCSLNYDITRENMRSLVEKLKGVSVTLQGKIQSRWKTNTYNGMAVSKIAPDLLQSIIDLILAAKALFSWLNRYLYTNVNDYSVSQDIINLCTELGNSVQKENIALEKEKEIISTCKQLVSICDAILNTHSEELLKQTAQLHAVELIPVSPGDSLGIEIQSTGSNLHFITGTELESPADLCEEILVGDEVIQVNNQVVVGWNRKKLIGKLQEDPNTVTLVLKKIPKSTQVPAVSESPTIFKRLTSVIAALKQQSKSEREELDKKVKDTSEVGSKTPLFEESKKSALIISSSAGSHSEKDHLSELDLHESESPRSECGSISSVSSEVLDISAHHSKSPELVRRGTWHQRDSQQFLPLEPEVAGQRHDTTSRKQSTKGMRSSASRRRISCRELGKPDCDGWLWKKKEGSMFVTQKWQHFWCVLKGHSLYWYESQQEEKAVGFVNLATYTIESGGEHKRKYVYRIAHEKFKSFYFAADNVSDMSKWINCLITAIKNCKRISKNLPNKEEDCYSETEPEDDETSSPQTFRRNTFVKHTQSAAASNQSRFLASKSKRKDVKNKENLPQVSESTAGATGTAEKHVTGHDDEMGLLFNRIKEGGVSLIGCQQPFTTDHFRRSFVKRSKNPAINEKALELRALQSTLKAKELELQVLNKILDDPELTAQKFRLWKGKHEELFSEIEKMEKAKLPGHKESIASKCSSTSSTESDLLSPAHNSVPALPAVDQGEMLVDSEPEACEQVHVTQDNVPHTAGLQGAASISQEDYFFI
ncbi:connector enhancer of kinase suppressor of ras 1 [Polypterus senegalus]|uniref:connector enhancer of kinase suppressor of ras 1 n=1 Tax=Polypterus senegalus TaxID=55291 RepID=UPI001963EF60|nr:connector enhancer of kinase suppressor of ras 1 [Polypterus senegalus]